MIITEKAIYHEGNYSAITLKSLRLKAENINRTIENLLNKKARIDLEIKQQRTVLRNLKKQSSLELKGSLKLETLEPLAQEQKIALKESTDPVLWDEASLLDKEIDRMTENLQTIAELEALGSLNQ